MKNHNDVKAVARTFQALGAIAFVASFIPAIQYDSFIMVVYGVVGFVWFYAIGGALMVLLDIAQSSRATAIATLEQGDRQKARQASKVSNSGKAIGLKKIDAKKRKGA